MSSDESIGGSKEGTLPRIPLFILPITIGILLAIIMSSCALTNCNEKDGPLKIEQAVNGLLLDVKKIQDQVDLVTKYTFQVQNNTKSSITALEDYDGTITTAISDINKKIDKLHPFTPSPDDTSQTGTGMDSPLITIELDADSYFRGEVVWIRGSTGPRDSVEVFILDPNDKKISGGHQPASENGRYDIPWITKLDHLVGEYKVTVKSNNQFSEELRFELK